MKNYILPAISLAILSSIMMILRMEFFSTFNATAPSVGLGVVHLGLALLLLCTIVKTYKSQYTEGPFTFGKSFGYSFKVTLCWAGFSAVISLIFFLCSPDVLANMAQLAKDAAIERITALNGSVSASEQEMTDKIVAIQSNPYVLTVGTLISITILGTINSLIASAIYKVKSEN